MSLNIEEIIGNEGVGADGNDAIDLTTTAGRAQAASDAGEQYINNMEQLTAELTDTKSLSLADTLAVQIATTESTAQYNANSAMPKQASKETQTIAKGIGGNQ